MSAPVAEPAVDTMRFLSVKTLDRSTADLTVRISYRGKIWLTFDEHQQLIAMDLPNAPATLTRSLPQRQRHRYPWSTLATESTAQWLADADAGWMWNNLTTGLPHHRVIAVADIEVRLRDGQLQSLHAHLYEEA